MLEAAIYFLAVVLDQKATISRSILKFGAGRRGGGLGETMT